MAVHYDRERLLARLKEIEDPSPEWVQTYLEQIEKYPLLTREQEEQLRCSADQTRAWRRIFEGHQRFVVAIAGEHLYLPNLGKAGIIADMAPASPLYTLAESGSMGLFSAWEQRTYWTEEESFADFAERYVRLEMASTMRYGFSISLAEGSRCTKQYAKLMETLQRRPTVIECALTWMLLPEADVYRVPNGEGLGLPLARTGSRRVEVALARAKWIERYVRYMLFGPST